MSYALLKSLRGRVERRIHELEPASVFPSDRFPWSKAVEKLHSDIKREAEAVLARSDAISNFDSVLPNQRALYQGENWKSFFLIATRQPVPAHAALCPQTMAALEHVPGLLNAFFSILQPGTEIPPHRGPYAGILRYHLGVRVPQGDVGIEVDGQLCRWQECQSLFFDDSFTHAAWNRTSEPRVVLFVDFVRPLPAPLSLLNRACIAIACRSEIVRQARKLVMDEQLRF